MIGKPSHIEISAPDTERAQRFWSDLLGWECEPAGNGARLNTGSVPGGIHPEDSAGMQVFFEVGDLDQAVKRVVELGGEVGEGSSEGEGGRYVHSCRDDQGVPFGLHEPADGH